MTESGSLASVSDEITVADDQRDRDMDVLDLGGDELTNRLHAGATSGQARIGQVVHEVLRHQLVHDVVVNGVLELVLKAGDERGVGVHQLVPSDPFRSTDLFNITSARYVQQRA